MKFLLFGPQSRLGVLQDANSILDLQRAEEALGKSPGKNETSIFGSLLSLIEAGERGLDAVRDLLERSSKSDQPGLRVELSKTQLQAPFPGQRFALAGVNYAAHVADASTNWGRPVTEAEVLAKARKEGLGGGFWAVSRPVGPGVKIELPSRANGLFDYEGEVAVVLGKGGKKIRGDDWRDHVWGTTLVVDWSARIEAMSSRMPFYFNKNFDGSKSIGPWITVGEADPTNCDIETRVNGELRQQFNSRDMMHTFGEVLEQLSLDLTLYAGDVLSGGTGAGTATDRTGPGENGYRPRDWFLKAGDRVEVSSPQLGKLDAQIVEGS